MEQFVCLFFFFKLGSWERIFAKPLSSSDCCQRGDATSGGRKNQINFDNTHIYVQHTYYHAVYKQNLSKITSRGVKLQVQFSSVYLAFKNKQTNTIHHLSHYTY